MLAGCKSVVNPFVHMKPDYAKLPADALREAAKEIEQAVQKGDKDAQFADREGLILSDPLIKQAIRTRAIRSEPLNGLLDKGLGMEGRDGLVYILRTHANTKKTTSKERGRNAYMVMNENTDRWAIYQGILEANKIAPRALSAVQEIFHEARVGCMKDGQKYQDASGPTLVKGQQPPPAPEGGARGR